MKTSKQEPAARRNGCIADRELVDKLGWGIRLDELDREMLEIWKSKSSQERMMALELLRQFQEGHPSDQIRLQRVYELVMQPRND
jgi:hypothetical protein